MITLIGLWLALAAACFVVGATILRRVDAAEIDRVGDRAVVSVWLGAAVVSVLLLAASLALPLSTGAGLAIVGCLVAASLATRSARAESSAVARSLTPPLVLASSVYVAGAAVYAAQDVTWYDTGLYHFGAIRWLKEYGAVAGLALIQPRLGLASSWLALATLTESGVFEGRTAALTGGFALLLGGAHFLLCAARCLARRGRVPDYVVVSAWVFLFPLAVRWGMFPSPSPDVPVMLLTMTVAWAVVALSAPQPGRARQGSGGVLDARLIPILLSAFAVTIKLNALPLAVVSALFYVAGGGAKLRRFVVLCVVVLIFSAPMVAYQIVTSGCPMLPAGVMCLDLPWTLDAQEVRNFSAVIREWGRWNGPTPPDANGFNWLWRGWLVAGTTRNVVILLGSLGTTAAGLILTRFGATIKVGRLLALAGLCGLAYFMMFRANNLLIVTAVALALATRKSSFDGKGWLMAIGLSGVGLLMYSAPTLRFGIGYAAVLWACFAITRAESVGRWAAVWFGRTELHMRAALAVLLIAGGVSMCLCRLTLKVVDGRFTPMEEAGRWESSLLLPPPLPRAVVTRERVNDFEFYQPVAGNQCWATPLPCTSGGIPRDFFQMPADITLRDPARGLAAGFRRGGRAVARGGGH